MTWPSVTLAALIQRVVIVAGAAALILAAFGLDSVPEVRGLGAPAFAASSPDDGVPGTVRAAAVPRWAAGGVGMRSALAGFVVCPPDRTRRSHGAENDTRRQSRDQCG
jgi:hypothetical protein